MRKRLAPVDFESDSNRYPTIEKRRQWLFEFLLLDLPRLDANRALGVRAEAWGIVEALSAIIEFPDEIQPRVQADGKLTVEALPTLAVLQQLQRELEAGIAMLREGRSWEIAGPRTVALGRAGDRIVRHYRRGTFEEFFRAEMVDAVQECWSQLILCACCNRIFLRIGKRKYCSVTCSQKARWDRFKPNRSPRNYRAEREHAIRKRLRANVRIGAKRKR